MYAKIKSLLVIAVVISVLMLLSGCGKQPQRDIDRKKTDTKNIVADKPLADFQVKLLDTASKAADSIPKDPFIKDRSRIQETVVDTCLKLGQPVRAVRYADNIENWRRGLCYANTAYYLAQSNCPAEKVQEGLDAAEKIAAMDHGQKWRSDRIRSRIAQTYTLLGKSEKAENLSQNLEESEKGRIVETEAAANQQLSFAEHVKKLDAFAEQAGFEAIINVLYGYAELFNRYYDDIEKRDTAQAKINTIWETWKLPVNIRVELLTKLTEIALYHKDNDKALALVNETREYFESFNWPLDKHIPMSANISILRYKAGDAEKALAEIDATSALYDEKIDFIWDIYRAETIRPVAAAYQLMGNYEKALLAYKKAVDGGAVNSNVMQRGEDLAQTCCDLALYAVEPDTEVWSKIDQISKELSEP